MKITFSLLLFLTFFSLVACSAAENQNELLPDPQNLTVANVYPFIDYKLRDQYWYYLKDANQIYRANVNQIAKNLLGTFLIITTWVKGESKVYVNTFVRLGDGYQEGSGANYGPAKLNPFDLSFVLGSGEYEVTTNQLGQLEINNQTVTESAIGEKTPEKIAQQKCQQVDIYLQQKYWYYLRNAVVVHKSNKLTNKNYYCLFNYVNIVGTFLVISTFDIQSQIKSVVTFVRLGDGYETGSQSLYKPADFTPIQLQLTQAP